MANCTRRSTKKLSPARKRASGRSCAKPAKTALMSAIVAALRIWICSPMARAASRTSRKLASADVTLAGLSKTEKVMQEPQPLGRHLPTEKIDASQVASGPGKAGDQNKLDRVLGDAENNRDRRGCGFGSKRSRCVGRRGDQRHATTN